MTTHPGATPRGTARNALDVPARMRRRHAWRADRDCMQCGHRKMPEMPLFAQHWPDCPALTVHAEEDA